MKLRACIILFILLSPALFAGSNDMSRDDCKLLAQTYPPEKLQQLILPRSDWKPFPAVSHPEGLGKIPAIVRETHIELAEQQLSEEWKHFPFSWIMFATEIAVGIKNFRLAEEKSWRILCWQSFLNVRADSWIRS